VKTNPDVAEEGQGAVAEVAAGGTDPAPLERPGTQISVEVLTRELREAQAEVRRLRSFLSHGLRQPMAALTIWAELLNAKQSAALDDQGRRYLRELTASVHRIAAMLSSETQAGAASSSAATGQEPRPGVEPPPSGRHRDEA
jgi:signal transduction histidine kinase